MEQKNEDFSIPYYIFDELISYAELTTKGKNRSSQWNNIIALVGLAKVNDRLTQEQATFLLEEYNRENLQ